MIMCCHRSHKSFLSVVDRLINLQISPEEALRELDAASTAYWKLKGEQVGEAGRSREEEEREEAG